MEDTSVVLRQMPSGKRLKQLTGSANEPIEFIEFSPNGRLLETRTIAAAEGGFTRTVRFREVDTGKELFKQTVPLNAFAVAPDRKTVALKTGEHTVDLVETATKKPLRQYQWKEQEVNGLSFSADGKLWATTCAHNKDGRGSARLWEAGTDRAAVESPFSLAGSISPDGKHLAAWTGLGPCLGGALVLWDLKTRKGVALAAGQIQTAGQVAFSRDNKWLVGVWAPPGEGGKQPAAVAELWALPSARRVLSIALPGGIHAASFSADGKVLALAGEKHSLLQQLAPLRDLAGSVALLTFSPGGKWLATGGVDGTVQLWDVGARKALQRFKEHDRPVQAVAFSPDGGLLGSTSADGTLVVWEVRTGRVRQRIKLQVKDWPHRDWWLNDQIAFKPDPDIICALSFSVDGRILIASTPVGRRRWNVETSKELTPLD